MKIYTKFSAVFLFVLLLIAFGSFAQTPGSIKTGADSIPVIEDSEDLVFTKTAIAPSFPGGKIGWKQYEQENLRQNIPVEKGAPAGLYQIIIRFVVKKDGTLRDINAETNFGYGMEEEAIRLLKEGPAWIPAKQNGQVVRCYQRQAVNFEIKKKQKSFKEKKKSAPWGRDANKQKGF